MPSFEETMAAHTVALNRHSDALENFTKHAGKPGSAQSTEEKPTRQRRGSTKEDEPAKDKEADKPREAAREPAKEDAPGIYEIVKGFLDFGEEDNKDDEDERDNRGRFVKKMLNYFNVDRARDIPEKNLSKVKRWCKLYADGEKVDFEVD